MYRIFPGDSWSNLNENKKKPAAISLQSILGEMVFFESLGTITCGFTPSEKY